MAERPLVRVIRDDLRQKMVLVAGPRQVGKTTLARAVLAEEGPGRYYTWDRRADRKAVLEPDWPPAPALIVLDEFHKYRHWKRWLKGEYDTHKSEYRFLLTGSARLDLYRRGGDSLQGRYHHHRLHPFTVAELDGRLPTPIPFEPLPIAAGNASADAVGDLLERSGFPEPLFAHSARAHRRWQKERLDRFFREDVRELEVLRDMGSIQLLADLLPERVGSPLSLNALREALEVSHGAVSHWVDVLERLYFVYRVPPYVSTRVRALKKENKAYLWDWSLVEKPGPRLENLVSSHLLKLCHHLEDAEGHTARLHYLRDRNGREVDFLVTVKKRPWFAVEVKSGDGDVSPHLRYFADRVGIPLLYQVVASGARDVMRGPVRVVPLPKFLAAIA